MNVFEKNGCKVRGIFNLAGKTQVDIYWVEELKSFCFLVDNSHYCKIEMNVPIGDVSKDIDSAELLDVLNASKCTSVFNYGNAYATFMSVAANPNILTAFDSQSRTVGEVNLQQTYSFTEEPASVNVSAAPGAVGVAFKDTSKFCGVFSTNGKDLCDVFYDSGMREYFYKDVNGKTVSFRLDDPRTGGPLEPNVLPEARKSNVYKFSNGTHGRIYTVGGMVLFEHTDKEGYYIMTLSTYDGVLSTRVGSFCPAECIV